MTKDKTIIIAQSLKASLVLTSKEIENLAKQVDNLLDELNEED